MLSLKHYFFLGFFLWCFSCINGQNSSSFNHISPRLNGKDVGVSKLVQDSLGNMWMLSNYSILKYDGYNYKLIKAKNIFKNWKQSDNIKDITKDKKNNIWLISKFGLVSKYCSIKGTYIDITSLIKEPIHNIQVKEDNVWLLTKDNILYRYTNSKIKKIAPIFKNNTSLNNTIFDMDLVNSNQLFFSTEEGKVYNYSIKSEELNEIIGPFTDFHGNLRFTTDKNNRLWIGTETLGLFVYDAIKKEFIQDSFLSKEKFNINKEMFLTLFYDSNGYIWGGTDGGGLYKIDSNNGKIDLFTKHASNEYSLGGNTILDVSEDSHKNIWITTNYGKINVLPFKNDNIQYHNGSANKTPQRILSIYKSSKGTLWLGTDGSGLTKVTTNSKNEIINESQYFNNMGSNRGHYVQSIIEDSQSNMWFGTYKNGLFFHNTKNNSFKKINIVNSKNQEATDVRTVFKDSKNRIWVGSNISINVYSSNLELLASFDNNSHDIKGSILESIIEDEKGIIWLALYERGLFKLNENIDNLKNSNLVKQSYYNENNQNKQKEVRNVKDMSLGKDNELWLINGNGKLLKLNTKNKSYSSFEHIKPLEKVNIATVIFNNDNLWLSSSDGIFCLNIKNSVIKTYDYSDGLQDNNFLSRSSFKDQQGILYFGGIKGLNYFNPKKIIKRKSHAKLYINEIKILNQPIDSLVPSQVATGIYNVESLKLKHNQSSFSFRFSAIDNLLNPKYYYAYKLNGFDKNWITGYSERIATYTNIPAGHYTFEVKAGTTEGNWDIPTKYIDIKIEQPLWNSFIAYLVYLCIIGLIIFGLRRWYVLKKNLFLEKVSHKKENEIHETKMNFFAKMSHEIQTPITLILGPINDMLSRAEQNGNRLLSQRLKIIYNNTERLSKIARELTLVRNKELNTLKLLVTKNNIHRDIEHICLSFKELARNKKIDFIVNCPNNLKEVWYDTEKIEHILYNLLSNAFKFTPKEGYVQLNVIPTNLKKGIKISITDSGPGISKNELNTIFELFYQSEIGKENKGSGIGLNLTKELIDLHKGKIEVKSILNEGTTFTVTLPVTEDAYNDSEKITTNSSNEAVVITINDDETLKDTNDFTVHEKTILIVEDNYNLQAFLKDLLIKQYNIILAENGEEGYYYAKNNFPDLILSDIMMPVMDGIKMCEKLQDNNLTKHIPIIFLTAKNSTNSKISGLKSGAIEYINKPFNTNELLLKVKNIILSREHIITKYRKEAISRPEVLLEKSQDEIFLENLVSNINLRLDNANFKMEELAEPLNMSYSSLYRKCQSLTGHSLVDFVRLLRLKKAAILITKYGYNISETSFMTGFNDPKYFSKCFKKHFEKTPGNFKKEAQKNEIHEYLKKYSINSEDIKSVLS